MGGCNTGSEERKCSISLRFFEDRHLKSFKIRKYIHNCLLPYMGYLSSVFVKSLKFPNYLALAGLLHALANMNGDCATSKMNAFFHIFHIYFEGKGYRLIFILNWFVKSCFVGDSNAEIKVLYFFIIYFLGRQNQRELFQEKTTRTRIEHTYTHIVLMLIWQFNICGIH